jgi:hypothetical protein
MRIHADLDPAPDSQHYITLVLGNKYCKGLYKIPICQFPVTEHIGTKKAILSMFVFRFAKFHATHAGLKCETQMKYLPITCTNKIWMTKSFPEVVELNHKIIKSNDPVS